MICLLFQAVGGALATVSNGTSQIGVDMALVGLSLQVLVMIIFCGFFGDYLVRYFHSDTYRSGHGMTLRLKTFFIFMGLAVLLILARCSYRLAELNQGFKGKLFRDESMFIGMEGV
jgi:hypothetical protein